MSRTILGALLCVTFISAISANSVSTDQAECPQICPAIYMPTCATDGKIFKEFSSSCELAASNCRLDRSAMKTYTQTDNAWCSSTFVENLRDKLSNLDYEKKECLKPCPMIYSPLCVSNGDYRATLSSPCELEFFNCLLGSEDVSKHFRTLKQEAC